MSGNLLISVVVPIYNTESSLPICIESIIHQTYRHLVIVLVDDGSPDKSGELCDQYAKIDERIHAFHIEHVGLSGARNYGIQKAMEYSSDYIAFVDSDDWIEPSMFELLLEKAQLSCADVVECGVLNEYPGLTVKQNAVDEPLFGVSAIEALIDSRIKNAVWNKIWKVDLFQMIRFPEGRVFEEIATTYKLLANAKVEGIKDALYHYVQRYEGISHSHDIGNLRDYWLAYYEQYLFCANKVAKPYVQKLLFFCAIAIARAWWWKLSSPKEENERCFVDYAKMSSFVKEHFPLCGFTCWPLSLRVSIFLARFNNDFSFVIAYTINQLYQLIRTKNLY